MKRALITGITGQDGAYLAAFLHGKGYQVFGGYRRTSSENFWRIEETGVRDKIELVEIDLQDAGNMVRLLSEIRPTEVYNLGAQSFVGVSFQKPVLTGLVTGMGVTNILEAIRIVDPSIRFYQASTSELYGKVSEIPQNEETPFHPRSPYAVAKLYGHWMTINYREAYNIFASTGILFNHESPLRGMEFVTRKITHGVASIHRGRQDCIEIGNLDARRDWGYAREYVEGMWMILQAERPDDFVLATGEVHSVREFIECSFRVIGVDVVWEGSCEKETGRDRATGKTIVRVNPRFFRPAEVDLLVGDPSKARKMLGWQAKTHFNELVEIMVRRDIDRLV